VMIAEGITIRGGRGTIQGIGSDRFTILGPLIAETDADIRLAELNQLVDGHRSNLVFDSRNGRVAIVGRIADAIIEGIEESVLSIPESSAQFSNVVINTPVEVTGSRLAVTDGLLLNSNLVLASTPSTSVNLSFQGGAQSIGGTGSIIFGGNPGRSDFNVLSIQSTGSADDSVTIAETISFTGGLGTIQSGSTDAFVGVLNIENAAGGIELSGTFLGTRFVSEEGFRIGNSGVVLDNATIDADVVVTGSRLGIRGGLTLSRSLTLASTESTSVNLSFQGGAQTLDGTGSIIFGGSPGRSDFNVLSIQSTGTADDSVTIAEGITIRGGFGTISNGSGGDVFIINGSVIDADNGIIIN